MYCLTPSRLQHILQEGKDQQKYVALAWIDNKNANDMVPESWKIDCQKMYKIFDKIINFITETMKNWKTELTVGGKALAVVKI